MSEDYKFNYTLQDETNYVDKLTTYFNKTRRTQGSTFQKEGNILLSRKWHSPKRVVPKAVERKEKQAATVKRRQEAKKPKNGGKKGNKKGGSHD